MEIAVRALSPGINDPNTAISVLNQLGAPLCDLAPLRLPTGVVTRRGRAVLVVSAVDYGGLTDAMFHMIRQNGNGSTAVLARMIEVLTAVLGCEHDPARVRALQRHADLVLNDAGRSVADPSDHSDVRARHATFDEGRLADQK